MQITIKMQDNHEMKKNREKNTTHAMLPNTKRRRKGLAFVPNFKCCESKFLCFFPRFLNKKKEKPKEPEKDLSQIIFCSLNSMCNLVQAKFSVSKNLAEKASKICQNFAPKIFRRRQKLWRFSVIFRIDGHRFHMPKGHSFAMLMNWEIQYIQKMTNEPTKLEHTSASQKHRSPAVAFLKLTRQRNRSEQINSCSLTSQTKDRGPSTTQAGR